MTAPDLRDAQDVIEDIESAYIPQTLQDEDTRAALFEAYRIGYLAGVDNARTGTVL